MRPILAAAFVALLALPSIAADQDVQWRAIRWGELKVGHARIASSTENRAGAQVHVTETVREMLYFQGKYVQFKTREIFVEKQAGEVLEISYQCFMEQGETSIVGKIAGGKVSYRIKAADGAVTESVMDWPSGLVGPRAAAALLSGMKFAPGAALDMLTYSFSVSAPVKMKFRVACREKLRAGGKDAEMWRVRVEGEDAQGIERQRWYDDRGVFVREWNPILGGQSEHACTEEQAKKEERGVVATYSVTGFAPAEGTVIHPRQVENAVFRLSGSQQIGSCDFSGPGQSSEPGDAGCTVWVKMPKKRSASAARPIRDPVRASWLSPNYCMDFEQGGLRELAEKIAGSEQDCLKAAEKLRAWTFCALAKNPLNAGMACASTAVANGEGDCTEHAVVLGALCRAAGIPARIVGGLQLCGAYMMNHAWNEVWAGEWVPMDATQETQCDACRIRLFESDLNGPNPESVLFGLNAVNRGLKVEVLGYSVAGRLIDPSDPNKGAERAGGDEYFHDLYGFGFRKAPAFGFRGDLRGMPGALISMNGKRGESVLIRAGAASYHDRLEALLRDQEKNFVLSDVTWLKVAGRDAVMAQFTLRGRGGYSPLTCFVIAGDALYTVETNNPTPDSIACFESVLKTMQIK